jgi:hypothetical protein
MADAQPGGSGNEVVTDIGDLMPKVQAVYVHLKVSWRVG